MPTGSAEKSRRLGMSFGTACGRLRKHILFHLLKQHNQNVCYRCQKVIESVDDLSIDHKIGWLDDPELFWNMDNIAFSHSSCNSLQGGITTAKKRWNVGASSSGKTTVSGTVNGCSIHSAPATTY